MAKRVSKFYGGPNPRIKIESFNKDEINKDNIVNQILLINKDDISSSLIMDLFGVFNGESLVHHYDTFEVPAGGFKFKNDKGKEVSNTKPFITTFGIWIFNIFFLRDFGFSHIFGGYYNENITKGMFEDMNQTLIYALLENKIDIEQYKEFIEYGDFIMPWETILSPAQSEGLLSCTKEIDKLKAKLIKENKEEIDKGNPDVAEKIEKELLAFAKEYLKDDPALDEYESGAGGTFGNNFKNMYIMKGAIRNTDPNAKKQYDIAISSFLDGITKDDYTSLSKSLSGGPFARSKKTEIGGYWEKLIETALNPVRVTIDDCGSDKYIEVLLDKSIFNNFMYSYIVKSNGELEELTLENRDKYINKKVKIRSVLFCKEYGKTGCVCSKCAGNFFNRRGNPNIGLACSAAVTALKLNSMKAFHSSNIKMSEINPIKAFGLK